MKSQPRVLRWVALVAAGVMAAGAPAYTPRCEAAAKAVSVEIRNTTQRRLRDVPVSFGQVFKRGDINRGVAASIGGRPVPVQVDVKRHHEDGSVRFAVISTVLGEVAADGKVVVDLADAEPAPTQKTAVSPSDLLKTDFDAVVTLDFPNGVTHSLSARKLLEQAGDQARTWLQGPLATEWLLSGPPVDRDGRADDDLSVLFQVRAYAGCRRVRVSVAVENCWDTWAGNVRYDVSVTVAGEEVLSSRAVDHRPLSRWRRVFWWGLGDPDVHVLHDLAYLSASGALPNYDRTLPGVEPSQEERRQLRREGPDWQIMGRGPLTAYMPTTGGRPEIAPYPAWTVKYLLGMDFGAKALVLAAGDLAGSWPIHVRARKTGRIMTIDQRPEFWLDERGKDRPDWKPDRHPPDPKQVRLTPDLAHQPSLAFVPYLVSGDYFYLEEACFWGNFCLLSTWPHPRRGAEGILSDQIRGDAWALRNIADAGWIACDDDPQAKYFEEKIRNNIADRAGRMLGPPEYNKIGAWGIRTTPDARIQQPANPNWMILAPWEQDYLIWSLHHLVELGYTQAAGPRDFLLRLRVGALTNAPDFDPMLATSYRFVVGEQTPEKQVVFYEDWGKLGRENARLSKPDLPNYGNSYAYSARAAAVCGIDGGFPKAREAVAWLEDHLADHRRVMGGDPVWAIVPGGAAGRR